jgi:hypothetical protein
LEKERHMRDRAQAPFLVAAAVALWSTAGAPLPSAAAQDDAVAGAVDACSLLANADVERITGSRLYGDPEPTTLGGGSACTYDGGSAQVILFSGERFDAFVAGFGHGN